MFVHVTDVTCKISVAVEFLTVMFNINAFFGTVVLELSKKKKKKRKCSN